MWTGKPIVLPTLCQKKPKQLCLLPHTQCLVTCGKGMRHRQVSCTMGTGEEKLSEHFCDPSGKPQAVGSCELPECASWQVGVWGAVRTQSRRHTQTHKDKTESHTAVFISVFEQGNVFVCSTVVWPISFTMIVCVWSEIEQERLRYFRFVCVWVYVYVCV